MRYATVIEQSRPEATPALLPQMILAPGSRASFWGGANVYGQPGTVAVASPKPEAIPPVSFNPLTQPSYCAPDYIMPNLYQSVPDNRWSHVPTTVDNQLPVPAVSLRNMAGLGMLPANFGGQFQAAQPQAFQQWPDINTTGLRMRGGNAGWKVGYG